MQFPIAVATPFLALLLLGFCSGPVEGTPATEAKVESATGSYVMARNFNYTKTPSKVYHDPSGQVAFTISGKSGNYGFHVVDDKQQSVLDVTDAQITCNDPFVFSIPAEQLTFTSRAPAQALPNKPPNARAWKITYQGSEFNYVRPKSLVDDATITGTNGKLDTNITNSFNDKNPAWKVTAFGQSTITINVKPSTDSKLPAKHTIGLLALQQQHAQKCEAYKSK